MTVLAVWQAHDEHCCEAGDGHDPLNTYMVQQWYRVQVTCPMEPKLAFNYLFVFCVTCDDTRCVITADLRTDYDIIAAFHTCITAGSTTKKP